MRKKLFVVLGTAFLCIGCGGVFGGSGGGNKGLLFYRFTSAGAPVLHRINSGGGGVVNVAGTSDAFEGSMDQNFNVYTTLNATGSIYRITGGAAFRLTNAASDFRPCVTPDGSRIAFASQRDGNNEVYVMNGDGSGQTNVSSDAGDDYYPAISADGSQVVFRSNRDGNGEIYIVNFNGTGLTRLTNDAGDDNTPAFTPDGTHVIFSSNRTGTYQIWRMDTAGGNLTQVTVSAGDKFHGSYKVNGSGIFYYKVVSGVRQIFRCNPDGSGEVQLTNSTDDSDKTPTWVY